MGPAVPEHIAICLLLEKKNTKQKTKPARHLFAGGRGSREWLLGEKQHACQRCRNASLLFFVLFFNMNGPRFNTLQQLFSFNFTYLADVVGNGFSSLLVTCIVSL